MSDDSQALRIFTWIVPRVNSTALTKCVGFVEDTVVWMEPYMTCHLNDTFYNPEWRKGDPLAEKMRKDVDSNLKDPEIMKMFESGMAKAAQHDNLFPQENFTQQWVKEKLEDSEPGKKFIFIKDQSEAISDHLERLPENVPTRHTFLIRHPREVYTSWKNMATSALHPRDPLPWDECHAANDMYHMAVPEFYQTQYRLWKHVKKHIDHEAIVIDGHDLASNPDVILPKLFEKLGIPFKESYLEWSGDPELVYSTWKGSPVLVIFPSYSDITSRAVHCTKFEAPKNPRGVSKPEWEITNELKEYIEGAMPFYEEMYAERLT